MINRRHLLGGICALCLFLTGCGKSNDPAGTTGQGGANRQTGLKTLSLPMRTDGPKSLDPVKGSTVYDHTASSQVYETLLQYKYLVRPFALEPLLLSEMPTTDDGLTYHFKIKKNVTFHDDPCFPDGKGREMIAADVFYSWKRMADDDNLPKSWWLFENTIVGFDAYRKQQNAADTFDYDAPVEGLRIISDHEFEVVLTEPVQRFLWVLAMFQTSIVPREAVEQYGSKFGRHPVGTGPFTMSEDDWETGQSMTFHRNPNYHECYYPDEYMPEDAEAGLTEAAGTRLPILDRIEITMFVQDQPMWLKFDSNELGYTQVPAENYPMAFIKRRKTLKPEFRRRGMTAQYVPLLDFIFIGFNMDDKLLGGFSDKRKWLRQAISLALDWNERNETFYNGQNIIYDGPIPPGLDGFPRDGKAPSSYRGPNLEKARELLAKAGYPQGKGLPALEYFTSTGGNIPEQTEMTARQLEAIGIRINKHLLDFSTFTESVHNKKAPFFSYAWGSDYPDAENNLALFYGPNESPGSNTFNYKRPEYDKLYEKVRVMPPSEERTRIYAQMRDMLIEDAPFCGSMARTRVYMIQPWLKNCKAAETFHNWYKYLDVADSKRD